MYNSNMIHPVPPRQDDKGREVDRAVATDHPPKGNQISSNDINGSFQRLNSTINAGGVGTWDYDLVSRYMHGSAQFVALHGISRGDPGHFTLREWRARLHPDDRQKTLSAINQCKKDRRNFDFEHRVVRADSGEIRWLRSVGQFEYDTYGTALRFTGASRDVTDRKRLSLISCESESHYRSALRLSRMASWETDFETGRRLWSPEGATLFGLSLESGTGQIGGDGDEYVKALHPEDRHLVPFFHLQAQTVDSITAEYRIVHPNGKVVWVAGRGEVVRRSPSGQPLRMISVVADVTEQKSAELHEKFLNKEVTHRSKNILGVVQAIANQTARNCTSIAEFQTIFQQRLHGMAVSHDILVGKDWRSASLEALVRGQLRPFVDMQSARVTIAGPAVEVSAPVAEAIGLALHELATNACKYGALSVQTGHVTVKWTYDREGVKPVVLEWIESGGPPVTPPTRKGFGSQIMGRMVGQAIGGIARTDYSVGGVCWKLELPPGAILLTEPMIDMPMVAH